MELVVRDYNRVAAEKYLILLALKLQTDLLDAKTRVCVACRSLRGLKFRCLRVVDLAPGYGC